MISILLDIDAGTAKLDIPTTIKSGGGEPVTITLSRDPGGPVTFQLALGPQSSTPSVLAYLDVFQSESNTVYTGTLDLTDARLVAYMADKQTVSLDCEVAWTQTGLPQIAPNFSLTVEPRMVQNPTTSEGGPVYALAGDISGFSGDIIVGDKTLTFLNGLIKSIA